MHIQTSAVIPPVFQSSFDALSFDEYIVFDGDYQKLVDRLSELPIKHCITGTETGVQLAAELANSLGLPGNDVGKKEVWRQKSKMQQLAQECGLKTAESFETSNLEQLENWYKQQNFKRAVIKPNASAGTDQVYFFDSMNDMEEYFHQIMGRTNEMGVQNQSVLAQEFIEGTEYALNSLSAGSKHFLTQIWEYKKVESSSQTMIYDHEYLVDPSSEVALRLQKYLFKLLDEFGVEFGPAHTEVIVNHNGIYLLELAARMDGIADLKMEKASVGKSQLLGMQDLLVDQKTFVDEFPQMYQIQRNAMHVELINPREVICGDLKSLQMIKSLPSFLDIKLSAVPGQKLPATKDIFSSPGIVFLVHESKEQLTKDYRQLRMIESEGLYE